MQLGFEPVTAVDLEPAAVDATRANASRNRVEVDVGLVDVVQGDLPRADLLVANIELGVVSVLLARWRGARAIVSGYLAAEAPVSQGWNRHDRVELDGWAADSFARATV